MATDADGRAVSEGDNMVVAGTVRRVEGDDVLLVTADGKHAFRAKAADLIRVDDLVTRAHANARYFETNAPASAVAGVGPNDLVRVAELAASQATQDAIVLAVLAGYALAAHVHTGTQVSLDPAGWSGKLSGSGITTVQGLADWIDQNVATGGK